jgi:erythromycin esterase
MIGDATIVLLSEGEHFGAEPLEFRNRVLEYLVQVKDFTAIAIESGVTEGRIVHNYVRGARGDLSAVVADGIAWTFDQLPQNRALVRWLREYNSDPRHGRKISFYGFDVPGSPGNPEANRGLETALTEATKFLISVDREATVHFRDRLAPFLPNIRFDPTPGTDASGYHKLNQRERDAITAAVADMVALFERREAQYIAASSLADYEWAHRAAIGARQADGWLRQVPLNWRASGDQVRFLDVACDLRDRALADNLEWIVKREGPHGKVLAYAHNAHLSTTSVTWNWTPLDEAGRREGRITGSYRHEAAGTYLRRRFGDQLLTIGNLIGDGEIGSTGFRQTLEQAAPGSMDRVATEVGEPLFLLDLRSAPIRIAKWLERECQLGHGFELIQQYHVTLEVAIRKAFDVLFYLGTITPASAESAPRKVERLQVGALEEVRQ